MASSKTPIISDTTIDYSHVENLNVGDVIKVEGNYEQAIRKLQNAVPTMDVFPINPGTDLYTMYGADHVVVTTA